MTTLVIPDELDEQLTALAKIVGLPKEEYALQLLDWYLQEEEDYQKALEISERVARGEEKTIPFAKALEQYAKKHGTSKLGD